MMRIEAVDELLHKADSTESLRHVLQREIDIDRCELV